MTEHEKQLKTLLYCTFRYWYLEDQKKSTGLGAFFEMFCVEQNHLLEAIDETAKDIKEEILLKCRDEIKEISDRYQIRLWTV